MGDDMIVVGHPCRDIQIQWNIVLAHRSGARRHELRCARGPHRRSGDVALGEDIRADSERACPGSGRLERYDPRRGAYQAGLDFNGTTLGHSGSDGLFVVVCTSSGGRQWAANASNDGEPAAASVHASEHVLSVSGSQVYGPGSGQAVFGNITTTFASGSHGLVTLLGGSHSWSLLQLANGSGDGAVRSATRSLGGEVAACVQFLGTLDIRLLGTGDGRVIAAGGLDCGGLWAHRCPSTAHGPGSRRDAGRSSCSGMCRPPQRMVEMVESPAVGDDGPEVDQDADPHPAM